jgi:hypothetical protein
VQWVLIDRPISVCRPSYQTKARRTRGARRSFVGIGVCALPSRACSAVSGRTRWTNRADPAYGCSVPSTAEESDGLLCRPGAQARSHAPASHGRAARCRVGAALRGREGSASALPFRGAAPGLRSACSGEPPDPRHRALRRNPRGHLLAARRGLQEPGYRHAPRLLRGRFLRPRDQVRGLRRRRDRRESLRAGPRADRG